jgi:hypothetical protein
MAAIVARSVGRLKRKLDQATRSPEEGETELVLVGNSQIGLACVLSGQDVMAQAA